MATVTFEHFSEHIEGDDKLLPCLGQLTVLEQDDNKVWFVNSEDFTSCFKLFRLPPFWNKYMAFGKLVGAKVFGGAPGKLVYPAMNVLPMGWLRPLSGTLSSLKRASRRSLRSLRRSPSPMKMTSLSSTWTPLTNCIGWISNVLKLYIREVPSGVRTLKVSLMVSVAGVGKRKDGWGRLDEP